MRIGVLGGSFDPIHHGHLLAARRLRERLGLDQVRLMPAGAQPFKTGGHGAPGADRAAMVALAVAEEPGLLLDDREVHRAGPSWTVDSLRELRAEFPEAALTLLLGTDAAAEFSAWREAAAIPALAEVVVFSRGQPGPVPAGCRSETIPLVDLSATEIRARVADGQSIRYLVPDAVADYIAAHRLYTRP